MSDWHNRWQQGRIGFHRTDFHPDLVAHEAIFLAHPDHSRHRVLVPLCGKSVDLLWLAERGHDVVGIELVEEAAHAFFSEQNLEPTVEERDHCKILRCGAIEIVVANVFDLGPEDVGAITRIWDRAALVAIPPEKRSDYVRHIRQLAGHGWLLLQNSFEYDQSLMQGPPWSVPDDEVRQHYGDLPLQVLSSVDAIDRVPFKDRGHTYWLATTYLIRGPSAQT